MNPGNMNPTITELGPMVNPVKYKPKELKYGDGGVLQ